MSYDLITGKRTGRDLSLSSISGDDDDDDSGSWWNPVSWMFSSSSNKATSADEEAVKKAKKAEKEAELQLKLDKQADALARKADDAKSRAAKHKSSSSGIGLAIDSSGKAEIVDLPGGPRRGERC